MRKRVLVDNFTLQGAYCFLFEGKKGNIYENCLSNLLEAVVLYDDVKAPSEILLKNQAADSIAQLFEGVLSGFDIHWESSAVLDKDLLSFLYTSSHYSYPDDEDVKAGLNFLFKILPSLESLKPFEKFESEAEDLVFIDNVGRDEQFTTNFSVFKSRHAWYALYCLVMALEAGINYIPNPTRVFILANDAFNTNYLAPTVHQGILSHVTEAGFEHVTKVSGFFNRTAHNFDLPLIYNHILKRAGKNSKDIVDYTLELRESKNAKAYRQWAAQIEAALEVGDIAHASKQIDEIKKHTSEWSKSLGHPRTKKITLSFYFISFDLKIPIPKIGEKRHFVFLHDLLRSATT